VRLQFLNEAAPEDYPIFLIRLALKAAPKGENKFARVYQNRAIVSPVRIFSVHVIQSLGEGIMATATLQRTASQTRDRIDVRLRPEQKSEIEAAAHIKGLTMTDFIVQNAITVARQTIREYETWTLERPDAEIFATALETTAKLGPQLTNAARRYKERLLPK
jgi:uncharacterized protein (DUF1778 family)